jgi:hypothetical protein
MGLTIFLLILVLTLREAFRIKLYQGDYVEDTPAIEWFDEYAYHQPGTGFF